MSYIPWRTIAELKAQIHDSCALRRCKFNVGMWPPDHRNSQIRIIDFELARITLSGLDSQTEQGGVMGWQKHVPQDLQAKYEFHEKHHAAAILMADFPEEWAEICEALREFAITCSDIVTPGGNESEIPRKFASVLKKHGWEPGNLEARTVVGDETIDSHTHEVDHIKGMVGCDFEWNSKDQTFDRDLLAFSEFFRFGKIAAGVIVTRSTDLNSLFDQLGTVVNKHGEEKPLKAKYGASTTHMGKLLYRLQSGRNGGCPLLIVGIKREAVTDAPPRPS